MTHDEFKNTLLTTGQNDPQTKFFLKNQHLSGSYIPQIIGDYIMSDYDNCNYTPNLDNENSLRETKRSDLRYVSYKLINEMYNMLMYSGDLCFSLHSIELVYQVLKLDDSEFVNWCAAHYFFNRYNLLCCELIESTYKSFKNGKSFNTILGKVIKCGSHHKKDVLMFSPDMNAQLRPLEKSIYRKNCYDEMSSNLVQENEYILLVEFENEFTSTIENMEQEIISEENLPENDLKFSNIKKDTQLLERMNISDKKIKSIRLVFVNEIAKDFKLKVFTMNKEEDNYFSGNNSYAIIKPEDKNNKFIIKQMETMVEFCTKVTMNPAVQQMILSTPSCMSDYLMKIAKSSSIIMNNPSTKHRLQTIIEQLVEKLNPSQLKSVRNSLTSNLNLIQTPSGTNKVLTTVEIVRAWLKYSQFQVLVFSENRIDCDMIHMGLLKSGIRSLCLNEELPLEDGYKDGLEKIMDILCNNHFYLNPCYTKSEEMKSILNEFRVVCCSKEELMNESLKNVTFSRILCDDANQMKESTLLMSLVKNCQQLTLLGDEKQLCPTSDSILAQSKGMSLSMFDRLIKQGVQPTRLNIQYCMSPSLSLFSSMKFYQGKIENGIEQSQTPLINGFDWPNPEINCAFIDVESKEEFVRDTFINNTELEVTCKTLMKMISTGDVTLDEIGLISSYAGQTEKLKNEMTMLMDKYPNLIGVDQNSQILLSSINTIEESQDMEKEFIMFSCVRSNSQGEIGILKDPRRLNTILTRARRGLIIVGNLQTLIKNEQWRDWLSWAQFSNIILKLKDTKPNFM